MRSQAINPTLLAVCILATALAAGSAPVRAAQFANPAGYRAAVPVHVSFYGVPGPGLAGEVDLRPQITKDGLAVRNQGNRGTCTVFATTFLIEYQRAGYPSQPSGLDLSEEYLNWAQDKVAGPPYQDGGFFTRMIAGYSAYGIANESEMPYQPTFNPTHPDTPSARTISHAEAMFGGRYPFVFLKNWDNTKGFTRLELRNVLGTLRSGRPVAVGIWWLSNFATVTVHGVPLLKDYPRSANANPATAPMFDGHSIDLVGFRQSRLFPGGGYFIFRNSFGPTFGDKGYGFLSFQYLLAYGNDGIAIAPPPRHPIYPRPAPKY